MFMLVRQRQLMHVGCQPANIAASLIELAHGYKLAVYPLHSDRAQDSRSFTLVEAGLPLQLPLSRMEGGSNMCPKAPVLHLLGTFGSAKSGSCPFSLSN